MPGVISRKETATGISYTGKCGVKHMFVAGDRTNDVEITLWSGTDATGGTDAEIVPTTTYDASALGLNGFSLSDPIICDAGVYIVITDPGGGVFGGNVEVTIGIVPEIYLGGTVP